MYAGLDSAIGDPTQEVAIKIKPLSMPSGESASSATPATGGPMTAPKPDPKHPKLKRNPQLVSTPSTVQMDDIYAAQLAQARASTTQQYLGALRDIGFTDEHGQFMPGLIETEAARRRATLMHNEQMAVQGVNDSAVRGGAFFSGRRAENLANAQDPYERDLSSLATDVPRQITDRYNDVGNLLSGYALTQDKLLAELAARQATAAQSNPSGPIRTPVKRKVRTKPALMPRGV